MTSPTSGKKRSPIISLLVAIFLLLSASFLVYWYFLREPSQHFEEQEPTTTESTRDMEELEPNDKPVDATQISSGTVKGSLGDGDKDSFKFTVPDGNLLRFSLTPSAGSQPMALQLLDPEQEEIWFEDGIFPGEPLEAAKLMSSESGGTYYLQVSFGPGVYELEISFESQNDGESGGDAGTDAATAVAVEKNLFRGVVGDFDEDDWYRVVPEAGEELTFATEQDSKDMAVQILDSDQQEIWYVDDLGSTAYESFTFGESFDSPYFYLRVANGVGGYTVSFD
ncbi:MAG: hypothetical protein U9M98_02885 [Patescibacteria group bacterium]|nr:hypothetical protein [Patescibacteria group bacterium]